MVHGRSGNGAAQVKGGGRRLERGQGEGGGRGEGQRGKGPLEDHARVRGGVRGEHDELGMADMWDCPQCSGNSFLSRGTCYKCGAERPDKPRVRSEVWPKRLLARNSGNLGAEGHGGGLGGGEDRVPLLRWGADTSGGRLQQRMQRNLGGEGNGGKAKAVQGGGKGSREEAGLRVNERGGNHSDENAEGEWVQAVKGRRRGNGARPKAEAGPPGGGKGSEPQNSERNEDTEGDEEVRVPPPYQPPLPRFILASRAQALESKMDAMGEGVHEASKRKRTEMRLEETKEQLREAGGGTANRGFFCLVNTRKKIARLEKALQRHHEELEELGGQAQAALEAERRQALVCEKCNRELENEKARHAYLAMQAAQEAGQQAHAFQGLRLAAEEVRAYLQKTQGLAAVPGLDRMCQIADFLEPRQYDESHDPILLGLEISDDDDEDEEDEEGLGGSGSMEAEAESRGKKRQ